MRRFVEPVIDAEAKPYILSTEEYVDRVAQLCAFQFSEKYLKESPLKEKLTLHVTWETPEAPALDLKVQTARLTLKWDATRRCASVSLYEREADGLIYSGRDKTTLLAEFVAYSVNSFVSPLKVSGWFEQRERAAAEAKALKEAAEKLAAEAAKTAPAAPVVATAAAVAPVVAAQPAATQFSMDSFTQ